jgi:hypothetical protein
MTLEKTWVGSLVGVAVCSFCIVANLYAQQAAPPQGNQALGNQALGNQGFFGAPNPAGFVPGAQGGAANADFDSLIDLIQSTVEYDSWMENGSGEGEIQPFPTGVYADAAGTLRFSKEALTSVSVRRAPNSDAKSTDARQHSALRYISLPQLEKAIAAHQAEHKPLPPEMLTLAGLQRVELVIVNSETQDLILAGPAGDWKSEPQGILVSVEMGQPVVRLDDLLTLWRRQKTSAAFGCSITPRQQALAKTQAFLDRSAVKPIESGERAGWLKELRDTLGGQDVEFFGLVPDSHLAMVLLVADYHMKLVGMGLAESVDGVTNYLDTVELLPDGSAPPMSVLRWWFTMRERPVKTTAERDVFQLPVGGVQVLSENELLAARGQRIHTNQSDDLNRRFAESFTEEFASLSQKYPLYGELQNVFDLALVLALIDREHLLERSGWQPRLFEDANALRLPRLAVPREVETVINHRVIDRRQIIAGISGGVWIDGTASLKVEPMLESDAAALGRRREHASGTAERWWWD